MDDMFDLEEDITVKKSIKFQPKARANPVKLASRACSKTSDGGHTVLPPKPHYADSEPQEDMPSNTDDLEPLFHEQGYSVEGADMSKNLNSTGDLLGPSAATEAASASTFHHNDLSTMGGSASELNYPDEVEYVDHDDPLLEAGKQVSVDNNQVATVLSSMDSLDDHTHHPSASVGKFQPKAISREKEQRTKSVRFLLHEEIDFSPLGYSSEAADNGIKQMTGDDNPEELFHLSSPTSDHNVVDKDTSEYSGIGPFDNDVSLSTSTDGDILIFPVTSEEQEDLAEASKTTSRTDVVDYEARYQGGHELEQPVEEGPIHETVGAVKAGESQRKLRKRPDKASTDIEHATDSDLHVQHSEILEMDDSPNDMEYQEEDMPKKKKYKPTTTTKPYPIRWGRLHGSYDASLIHVHEIRQGFTLAVKYLKPKKKYKPKNQISETEKQKRRCKKVSNESDMTEKEQPKKKFPHSTQRKRRQVDKALLQTPEDEINVRQIAIKDLIMLAEAKEKMSSKTAAALGKSFSIRSQEAGMYSNSEVDLFGEDEERNPYDDEASERLQATQKKLNYHSYMNKPSTVRWSKSEIDLLYQAIHQFGTDFTMIQQLFPNRTRHQVKLKFKNEERKHPLQVQDALFHRCKDNSHFKQVIEQLNIKPKESTHDVGDELETNLLDPKDENLKNDAEDPLKDKESGEGREDQGRELNVAKDEPKKPESLNGLEGLFDWDENMDDYTSWDYES